MSTTEQSLRTALSYLLEQTETPPEKNCSCHLSPPCSNCDWSDLREAIDDAEAALRLPETTTAATLWCLHLRGPDDVHAAPSKAHAEAAAATYNAAFKEKAARAGILFEAVAAPWPHSAESHAASVANFIPECILPAWQAEAMTANAAFTLAEKAGATAAALAVADQAGISLPTDLVERMLFTALAAGQPGAQVPAGWKLVPELASEEQLRAALDTGVYHDGEDSARAVLADEYRTMVAAAPPAQGIDPGPNVKSISDTARLDWLEQNGCMRFHGPHEHQRGPSYTWFDSETTDSDYSPTLRDAIDAVLAIEYGVPRG